MNNNILINIWQGLWKQHYFLKEFFSIKKFANLISENNNAEKTDRNNAVTQGSEEIGNKPPNHSYTKRNLVGLILGPLLFVIILFGFSPTDLGFEAKATLAITAWIATWWITEAVPIPATALLPIILFPSFGALEAAEVVSSYGNDIIFLFLGGFLIAAAMEKWNLHLRIALTIINFIGVSPNRLVLGFMMATGFLSLWISNTAATMLMIPIGLAIIAQAVESFKNEPENTSDLKKFEKSLIFGIGYAATIAGSGTLISGTANPIFVGQANEMFGIEISFGQLMLVGVPFVAIFIAIAWLYLTRFQFRIKIKAFPGGDQIIKRERDQLGIMRFEEKTVLAVFIFVAFMWISRTFIWDSILVQITDGMIAMIAVILLFAIPSANKDRRILEWDDTKEIPWGILVLFGGGLAIAAAFSSTGLAEWIGTQLSLLEGVHYLLIFLITIITVLLLTEITSTTATATLLTPIIGTVAVAVGVNPVMLMLAGAFATNASFMLPVATPPNAIMYGTEKVTMLEMLRVGGILNIIAALLVFIIATIWAPMVWGMDLLAL